MATKPTATKPPWEGSFDILRNGVIVDHESSITNALDRARSYKGRVEVFEHEATAGTVNRWRWVMGRGFIPQGRRTK